MTQKLQIHDSRRMGKKAGDGQEKTRRIAKGVLIEKSQGRVKNQNPCWQKRNMEHDKKEMTKITQSRSRTWVARMITLHDHLLRVPARAFGEREYWPLY